MNSKYFALFSVYQFQRSRVGRSRGEGLGHVSISSTKCGPERKQNSGGAAGMQRAL